MSIAFKSYRAKNGVLYGVICECFRDPVTKKSRTLGIESFANLEKLRAENPNFDKEIQEKVERLRADKKAKEKLVSSTIVKRIKDDENIIRSPFYYGSVIYRKVWELLELHTLLKRIKIEQKINYPIDTIAYNLASSKIANRLCSKRQCYMNDLSFLFNYDGLKKNNYYDVLDVLAAKKSRIVNHINKNINKIYKREVCVVLYDVTTFYFESFNPDEIRDNGLSKDKKTAETQVVMGLLIDQEGLPIDYELFKGDTHEMGTLLVVLENYLKQNNIKTVKVVADAGLNSAKNICTLDKKGHNFIVTQSLLKLSAKERKRILDDNNWKVILEDDNVSKYQQFEREVKFTDEDGSTYLKNYRLIVHWSHKRYVKDMADIDKLRVKAEQTLQKGTHYCESIKKSEFICKRAIDENGNLLDRAPLAKEKNYKFVLDVNKIEKIREAAGFYAFITNDCTSAPEEIYQQLRALWKIEACFRILKSNLNARPLYVYKKEHIEGHFVMCFMALVIERLVMKVIKAYDESLTSEKVTKLINQFFVMRFKGINSTTGVVIRGNHISADENHKDNTSENKVLFDKILSLFKIQPLDESESFKSFTSKMSVTLGFNLNLVS